MEERLDETRTNLADNIKHDAIVSEAYYDARQTELTGVQSIHAAILSNSLHHQYSELFFPRMKTPGAKNGLISMQYSN
jgi:hypothetical protein